MELDKEKVLRTFSPRNIAIAIFIGLGVTAWSLYNSITEEGADKLARLTEPNYYWLSMAFLTMILRDLFYMYRIKTITGQEVTWKGAWYIIILWEFASAVTPSVVGGTMVAVFIINREGIPPGKAMAYTMLTAVLDNFFFLIASPIVLFITGWGIIPEFSFEYQGISLSQNTFIYMFYASYGLIGFYSILMVFGILILPGVTKKLLFWSALRLRMPPKWKRRIANFGTDMEQAAFELKGHSYSYWAKAIISTIFVWSSRYFILNCILAAFIGPINHPEVFSKHVLLWVAQLVSITPGASGLAEKAFELVFFNTGGIQNTALLASLAFFWRLATYYPYLVLGSVFLPRWLRRVLVER